MLLLQAYILLVTNKVVNVCFFYSIGAGLNKGAQIHFLAKTGMVQHALCMHLMNNAIILTFYLFSSLLFLPSIFCRFFHKFFSSVLFSPKNITIMAISSHLSLTCSVKSFNLKVKPIEEMIYPILVMIYFIFLIILQLIFILIPCLKYY